MVSADGVEGPRKCEASLMLHIRGDGGSGPLGDGERCGLALQPGAALGARKPARVGEHRKQGFPGGTSGWMSTAVGDRESHLVMPLSLTFREPSSLSGL